MPITGHPPHRSRVRDPRTGLRPRVFDGKALVGPRMNDSRAWEPGVGDPRYSLPRHGVLLAASLKRAPPEVDNVVTKRAERARVCGNRVIRKVPAHHLP